MSILIKGLEMPKSSRRCPFTEMDDWGMRCTVGGKYEWHKDRLCDECPLVPVPPHGRLIDADAILGKINAIISAHPDEADLYEQDAVIVRDWLRSEPTIIEAEEGE